MKKKAVPENKLTLESLAEGFYCSGLLLTSSVTWDLSVIQALKLKQVVEGFVQYRNILEK